MKFESKEEKIKLYIDLPKPVYDKILDMCRNAETKETGGLIIGYYSANLKIAYICDATKQTPDSVSKPCSFERGIRGLKKLIIKYWGEKLYYLGEWHFHPHNSPNPSSQDVDEMIDISHNDKFKCPEPILLIVGQKKDNFFISLNIFIGDKMLPMILVEEGQA